MKSIHHLKVSTRDLDKIQSILLLGFCAGTAKSTLAPEKEREMEDLLLKIFEENDFKYNGDNFSLDKIIVSPNFQENTIAVTSDDLIKL
ncbi:hypothetical protein KPE82_11710 [Acinetobacter baumannii]|uniref:hypothetical protein n=1 Tax=Acinetobacter baumannii TaxID=470 RepID=UPI001C0E5837|nr:hypothetical protein [Acinetobacter baumannii]MBU3096270.1 hypothetical protein [Acinetobacter baumannii]